jgi:hypothetical protein
MGKHGAEYERMPRDSYYTPDWVTKALLDCVTLPRKIWEPACGQNYIVKSLYGRGYEARGTDVDGPLGIDFLTARVSPVDCVVTNPPFGVQGKLAVQFIQHALDLTETNCGMVAMLLPVDFDSGVTRRHLFADHPAFSKKIVLTKRIRWVNLPQKAAGPKENHAWFVWDWKNQGGATIAYAPLPETA